VSVERWQTVTGIFHAALERPADLWILEDFAPRGGILNWFRRIAMTMD
jgi:hypothetical protein